VLIQGFWSSGLLCREDVKYSTLQCITFRGSIRSTRSLGQNLTARGQNTDIWIAMPPQTFWGDMEAITVQKTSNYYTT